VEALKACTGSNDLLIKTQSKLLISFFIVAVFSTSALCGTSGYFAINAIVPS